MKNFFFFYFWIYKQDPNLLYVYRYATGLPIGEGSLRTLPMNNTNVRGEIWLKITIPKLMAMLNNSVLVLTIVFGMNLLIIKNQVWIIINSVSLLHIYKKKYISRRPSFVSYKIGLNNTWWLYVYYSQVYSFVSIYYLLCDMIILFIILNSVTLLYTLHLVQQCLK